MLSVRKTLILTSVVIASALSAGCGSDDPDLDSDLTIRNSSSFSFIEINLSPVGELNWGADLLGSDILEPGDVLELSGIACDDYDIRVIDEDTDECILTNVSLCAETAEWVIDNSELASCVL